MLRAGWGFGTVRRCIISVYRLFRASIRDDGKRLRIYEEPIGVPFLMSEANICEAGGSLRGECFGRVGDLGP